MGVVKNSIKTPNFESSDTCKGFFSVRPIVFFFLELRLMRYTAAENSGKIQSFSVSDGAEINHTRIYGNEYACHFFLFFNRKTFVLVF